MQRQISSWRTSHMKCQSNVRGTQVHICADNRLLRLSYTRSHLCLLQWTGTILWERVCLSLGLLYDPKVALAFCIMSPSEVVPPGKCHTQLYWVICQTHIFTKSSAECASGDTDHRRHCSIMWGLRISVDNSGVLIFPDVWHYSPGWAGILFLNSDKRELLWAKDSPYQVPLSFPLCRVNVSILYITGADIWLHAHPTLLDFSRMCHVSWHLPE